MAVYIVDCLSGTSHHMRC